MRRFLFGVCSAVVLFACAAPIALVSARVTRARASTRGQIPTLADDIRTYLGWLNDHVGETVRVSEWSPSPFPPMQIPHIDQLLNATSRLNGSPTTAEERWDTAQRMTIITQMLGRATSVGDVPIPHATPEQPFLDDFPANHHFHTKVGGMEWYYVLNRFPIQETHGARRKGEMSLIYIIQHGRAVSYGYWKAHLRNVTPGWEDDFANTMGMTCYRVDARFFSNDNASKVVERTVSVFGEAGAHWAAIDPDAIDFSVPGEPFHIRVGNYSMTAQSPDPHRRDIIPLNVSIHEPDLDVDFSLHKQPGLAADADSWFLNGAPLPGTLNGSGFADKAFYYNFPQLVLKAASVRVLNETWDVTGDGSTWIGHQMNADTLENPNGALHPIPYIDDDRGSSWLWQFVFTDDGMTAYTIAAFAKAGTSLYTDGFGYMVRMVNGYWHSMFAMGIIDAPVDKNVTVPAGANPGDPFVSTVGIAAKRSYLDTYFSGGEGGNGTTVSGRGAAWATAAKDPVTGEPERFSGDLNGAPTFRMATEVPADFEFDFGSGWGFLETIGGEPQLACDIRYMHYLRNSLPTNLTRVKRTGF